MNEARSLTYVNSIVDIYSNSWGPRDDGVTIAGPGNLTRSALQSGVNKVCVQFRYAFTELCVQVYHII